MTDFPLGNRILVLGCSGSGKSTFARALRDRTGSPLVHLDLIWWRADRTHISREEFDRTLAGLLRRDKWILDGDYSRTYEVRIRACDTVIFLDFGGDVCMAGIRDRIGKARPDMPWTDERLDPQLEEQVLRYRKEDRPKVYAFLEQYPEKHWLIFRSREEADAQLVCRTSNQIYCNREVSPVTDQERIRRTEAFVKDRFDASAYFVSHPEEKAYRLEHTYRVANIGRRIAAGEGFSEAELVIACLLHDVSYCEEFGEDGWKDHGRRAAQIARPFLSTLGLPEVRIRDICYGIAIHVDDLADFEGELTPFAMSVGDADNIDRFDAYRIHETLCFDRFLEMKFSEKREYVGKRLKRLRELIELPLGTQTAQALWQDRLSFQIAFFQRLYGQLEQSERIDS